MQNAVYFVFKSFSFFSSCCVIWLLVPEFCRQLGLLFVLVFVLIWWFKWSSFLSLLFLLVLIVLSGLPLSSCLMWVLSLLLILFCLFPVLLWRLDFFHVWLYKLPSLWLFSLDHLGLLLILLIPVLPTRICYLWTQLSAIKAHFFGENSPSCLLHLGPYLCTTYRVRIIQIYNNGDRNKWKILHLVSV